MAYENSGEKLKQMATLGMLVEETQKKQFSEALPYRDTLEKVAVQLDAAHLCIQEALDLMDDIPGSSGWILSFALKMDQLRYIRYAENLREVKKQRITS